jgi:hypothetical protein
LGILECGFWIYKTVIIYFLSGIITLENIRLAVTQARDYGPAGMEKGKVV